MRATGVGWAVGAGRVGGMLGPLLGRAALAGHWDAFPAFLAAGLPMLLVAVATFLIGLVLAPAGKPAPRLADAAPRRGTRPPLFHRRPRRLPKFRPRFNRSSVPTSSDRATNA